MSYEYLIVDAFSDIAFGGVPVAVFPEVDDIPPAYLKPLSEEVVADATVFIHSDSGGNCFSFHFYDKSGICLPGAHTIVAGLAALKHLNLVSQDSPNTPIKIVTTEDTIEAYIDTSSAKFPFVLRQKTKPEVDYFVPELNDIACILGLDPADIAATKYNCMIASSGHPHLIVPLKSYHAVHEAYFNIDAWSSSSLPASLIDNILVFSPCTDPSGADFHLRLLQKGASRTADPAIGEALPAFASYLACQKHVQLGTHSITVRRGANDVRQSFLHLEFDKTEEGPLTLRIGGAAIVTAKGQFLENGF